MIPEFFKTIEQASHSTLPAPNCPALISGLTRGGTLYVCNLLNRLGVRAAHENLYSTSGVKADPHPKVEVSGFSAPFVYKASQQGIPVVHLLRHPVPCINSNVNFWALHFGIQTTWEDMCDLYLRWHQMIDEGATYEIRLENIIDCCGGLMAFLCHKPNLPLDSVALQDVRLRGSSTAGFRYTWEDLPQALKDYAERKGYGRES